jgi:hypothetical protein
MMTASGKTSGEQMSVDTRHPRPDARARHLPTPACPHKPQGQTTPSRLCRGPARWAPMCPACDVAELLVGREREDRLYLILTLSFFAVPSCILPVVSLNVAVTV